VIAKQRQAGGHRVEKITAGARRDSGGDQRVHINVKFHYTRGLNTSSSVDYGRIAAVSYLTGTWVVWFVSGGGKFDSCGGRKSDSRQRGLAAG
jgi:hypothetical protein